MIICINFTLQEQPLFTWLSKYILTFIYTFIHTQNETNTSIKTIHSKIFTRYLLCWDNFKQQAKFIEKNHVSLIVSFTALSAECLRSEPRV